MPLNSLHHSKFLDDTGQFLLKYISNSVSLLLTFIADSSATAGNINGFNTWQHMHNMTDFRNLTSICYGQMWENAEVRRLLGVRKKQDSGIKQKSLGISFSCKNLKEEEDTINSKQGH